MGWPAAAPGGVPVVAGEGPEAAVAEAGEPAGAEGVIVFRWGARFPAAGVIVFRWGRYTTRSAHLNPYVRSVVARGGDEDGVSMPDRRRLPCRSGPPPTRRG